MRLHDKAAYLVLDGTTKPGQNLLRLVPESTDLFSTWTPQTRISPVFAVTRPSGTSPLEHSFAGRWHFLFLGPVHPESVPALADDSNTVWLSLGLFNVLVATQAAAKAKEVVAWARAQQVPYEHWQIDDGIVTKTEHVTAAAVLSPDWRATLNSLWTTNVPGELREALQEYCPLMAATIARSEVLVPAISTDLCEVNLAVKQFLDHVVKNHSGARHYLSLGQLLTINAALSRFSSQTFAGTPPISATECHFWLHSLLGVGLATLALRNVCAFLERQLGNARIGERFAGLKSITTDFDTQKEFPPDRDFLQSVELASTDTLVPIFGYFSARDGYRSTEWAVSAPLAAVAACNSKRWSLLTLTHEFSHVVVRAILAELYPDFDSPQDLDTCLRLLDDPNTGSVFDEIRKLLLFSLVKMDDAATGRNANEGLDLTVQQLRDLLQRWRQDVDEILVHVFDFMYFYGQDEDKYVSGIWASWGTIPNINHRVLDYVVRTVCALLTKHLRRADDAEEIARQQVLVRLESLKAGQSDCGYLEIAIDLLRNRWTDIVLPRVFARRQLVKIVHCFLFSEAIATAVRREEEVSGGAGDKEGYRFAKLDLEDCKLTNPLHFVEVYTDTMVPNPIVSAWMLYVLAFGFRSDG